MMCDSERNEIMETIMYAIKEIENGQETDGIRTLEFIVEAYGEKS